MKDKLGKDLEKGALVDILMPAEIFRGVVLNVQEGGLAGPNGKPVPATLLVNLQIPLIMDPGQEAPVYLVALPKNKLDEPKGIVSKVKSKLRMM